MSVAVPPIIGFDNRFDQATITVGSGGARAARMKDRNIGLAWESEGTDPAVTWIEGTWPAPVTIALAGLFGINLSVLADWRFRAWKDLEKTELIHDTTVTEICPSTTVFDERLFDRPDFWTGKPPQRWWQRLRRKIIAPLPQPRAVRCWRFDLFDANNPDNVLRVSRGFIGDAFIPRDPFDLGYQRGINPYYQESVAPNGAREVSETRPGSQQSPSFSWLTRAERGRLQDMLTLTGATGEAVWIPHPDDPVSIQRDAMLGTIENPRPIVTNRNGSEPDSTDFTFREWM